MRIGFMCRKASNRLIQQMEVERHYTDFESLKGFIRPGDVIVIDSIFNINSQQLDELKSLDVTIESSKEGIMINSVEAASEPKPKSEPKQKQTRSRKSVSSKKSDVSSEYLTPSEAMKLLKIGHNKIYTLMNSGELEAAKIGKGWRISRKAIDEYMKAGVAQYSKTGGRPKATNGPIMPTEDMPMNDIKFPTEYEVRMQKLGMRIESFQKTRKLFNTFHYEPFSSGEAMNVVGYTSIASMSTLLTQLKSLGIVSGILTGRKRRFLEVEKLPETELENVDISDEIVQKYEEILDVYRIKANTRKNAILLFRTYGYKSFNMKSMRRDLGLPGEFIRSLIKALISHNLVVETRPENLPVYNFVNIAEYPMPTPKEKKPPKKYKAKRYNIPEFVEQMCIIDPKGKGIVYINDLYDAYIKFSEETGYETPVSATTLSAILGIMYPSLTSARNHLGRYRTGITLKSNSQGTTETPAQAEPEKEDANRAIIEQYAGIFDKLSIDPEMQSLANDLIGTFGLSRFSYLLVISKCGDPTKYQKIFGKFIGLGILGVETKNSINFYNFTDPAIFNVDDAYHKVPEFVESMCILDPDESVYIRDLYQAYLQYCKTIGYENPAKKINGFGNILNHVCPTLKNFKELNRIGGRHGIGLRPAYPKEEESTSNDTQEPEQATGDTSDLPVDPDEVHGSEHECMLDTMYKQIQLTRDPKILELLTAISENLHGKGSTFFDEDVYRLGSVFRTTLEMNTAVMDAVYSRTPTDHIKLSAEGFRRLYGLWSNNKGISANQPGIPSDIFVEGTIPLEDCILELQSEDGRYHSFRVVIFDKATADKIGSLTHDADSPAGCRIVGAVVWSPYESTVVEILTLLVIFDDEDYVQYVFPFGFNTDRMKTQSDWQALAECCPRTNNDLNTLIAIEAAWYSVQIALLNPILKTSIIFDGRTTPVSPRRGSRKQRYKVKYMKHYVIDARTIDDAIPKPKGKYARKTMLWYVIGHWCNKNGKKFWVKPYWKGPLRSLKSANTREREIAQTSDPIEDAIG